MEVAKKAVGRPRLSDDEKSQRKSASYLKRRDYTLDRVARRAKDGVNWYIEYKRSLCCVDCGLSFREYHDLCDFHHIDPSTKDKEPIGKMVRYGSRTRAMAEIAKCVPLCANCHRIRHAKERMEKTKFAQYAALTEASRQISEEMAELEDYFKRNRT